MRDAARAAGLRLLAAPVRPSLKSVYPLIPIERYMEWRREDGSHFDPWLRLHERVGGRIVAPSPVSMTIEAPVSDWEEWTGVAMPEDGDYLIPGGWRRSRCWMASADTSSRTSGWCTTSSAGRRARPPRDLDQTVGCEATRSTSGSSSSARRGLEATSRKVRARRCRNEPSNRLCLRSGS